MDIQSREEMWAAVERLAAERGSPWEFIPGPYATRIMRHKGDGFEVLAAYHPRAPHREGEGLCRHLVDLLKFPEGIQLTDEERLECLPYLSQNFRQTRGMPTDPAEVRGPIDISCRCDVASVHGPDLLRRMSPWYERTANELRGLVRTVEESRGC